MRKKKQRGNPDKQNYHIFGNKQLNEMFCDSREASIDFCRLSVEKFDEWFDSPTLKVTHIGEREHKIVAYMAGLMEAAFELGWNEAVNNSQLTINNSQFTTDDKPRAIKLACFAEVRRRKSLRSRINSQFTIQNSQT